jgi:hypothetical protein
MTTSEGRRTGTSVKREKGTTGQEVVESFTWRMSLSSTVSSELPWMMMKENESEMNWRQWSIGSKC